MILDRHALTSPTLERPVTPTPRRILVALFLPLALAGCSTGTGTTGGDGADGPLVPAVAPQGWSSHDMGPVTVGTPPEWEEIEARSGASSDESWALRAPGDGPGTGVHTTFTAERSRDADAAIENLRNVGDASVGARDVEVAELSWPGAQAAGWLGYEATVAVQGEDVAMRYEYLVLDLEGSAQTIVGVIAPVEGFEDSGAHDVLASVEVR